MVEIIILFVWCLITIKVTTIITSLITAPDTLYNCGGWAVLFIWLVISYYTKCFLWFYKKFNKKFNKKNEKV